jgi:hypothetical protein
MPSPLPPIAAFFDESLSHTGGAAPRFVPAEEEGAPEWEVIGTPGGRQREAPRPRDKVLRRALGEGRLITELVVEQVEAGAGGGQIDGPAAHTRVGVGERSLQLRIVEAAQPMQRAEGQQARGGVGVVEGDRRAVDVARVACCCNLSPAEARVLIHR